MRNGLVGLVLAVALLVAPVTAMAGEEAPDGRARISFVTGMLDDDGRLWFKLGFYQPWGDSPPDDLFSLFWSMEVTVGDQTSAIGWETHDGVQTFLGQDGTEAYLLDNGCIVVKTTLFPTGDYSVSIATVGNSWLDEATTEVMRSSESMGTSAQFIETGDPLTAFGTPIFDLTSGQPVGAEPTTPSTEASTTTDAPTTTDAGTAAPPADDGGGSNLLLILGGFAAILLFATWYFWRTGRLFTTKRYAYRVDSPALDTMVEEAPPDEGGDARP